MLKNLDDIQKSFEKYYTSLYSNRDQSDTQSITEFLNSLDLPNIGTQINEQLTQPITREEINDAISSLNNNKSPGVDGFPPEWYKTMREHLVPLLDTCFNYILEDGSPPPSWREAFISVIPKEGKDRTDCKGYRPISVLNADYKLYATILTKRMETAMHDLIDEDQTGFIRNRQTQDNIRRSLHIIENINKTQSKAIILSLDAEMAFDSVGWNFLYAVMKRFGFGNKFISCIQALYSSPIARVKVNGSLSDAISLERGCRQGCPASPSLFNMFIEPLAQAIRQEVKLRGIFIGGEEYKVSLYADDVLITLSEPASGLPILMDMLETYGKYSGYVLNINKTQVMTFNFAPTQEFKTKYTFNWYSTQIKYLGVYLTKDLSQLFQCNYNNVSKKIYEDLNRWSLLPLDFGNRIRTVKMNIMPRLLYLFLSLPTDIPTKQFRKWNKHISLFLWNNKRPRVKFSTLQLPRERGGMVLPSLKDYYVSAQLRPLVCLCNPSYKAKWKDIETSLTDVPLQALIGCTVRDKARPQTESNWVNLSLKIWFEIVKRYQLQREVKLLSWPAYDPDYKPSLYDFRYKQWAYHGITSLCTIVKDGKLHSFEHLCKVYGLRRQDFYRYLQMSDYFCKEVRDSDQKEWSKVVQLFVEAYNCRSSKGLISKLYHAVTSLKKDSTEYVKQRWEKELDIVITKDIWMNAWKTQSTTTNSLGWRDFCWKNLIRFFITPKQKGKQTDTQLRCWRECGENMVDHAHIFWLCPPIQTYWREVTEVIDKVLGFSVDVTFLHLYLGNFPEELDKDDEYLLKIMMVAGKKAITKYWLQKDTPTVGTFVGIVKHLHLLEQMTYSLRLQKEIGERKWGKWSVYMNDRTNSID